MISYWDYNVIPLFKIISTERIRNKNGREGPDGNHAFSGYYQAERYVQDTGPGLGGKGHAHGGKWTSSRLGRPAFGSRWKERGERRRGFWFG